jgi:hypothetical protein
LSAGADLDGAVAPGALRPADRAAYLDALVRRYRILDLAVLTPEALDENLPVLLRQVFVEQMVRPDPPLVELPRELWSRLVESGDLDATEATTGQQQDGEYSEEQADRREWVARRSEPTRSTCRSRPDRSWTC